MENYLLIQENSFEKARKEIKKNKGKNIIFSKPFLFSIEKYKYDD